MWNNLCQVMTMTTIRCVKAFFCIIIAYIACDYFYVTSDFALKHTHWLNAGDVSCGDVYFLVEEDMPQRNKMWSVQYRFIVVILWLYDDQGNIVCRYASKGIDAF